MRLVLFCWGKNGPPCVLFFAQSEMCKGGYDMNAFDRIAGYAALKDELERCCAFVRRLVAESGLFLDALTRALLQKAVLTDAEVRALARMTAAQPCGAMNIE